jgi:hypothetical protein
MYKAVDHLVLNLGTWTNSLSSFSTLPEEQQVSKA